MYVERISNNYEMDMVFIKGGSFLMGSPKSEKGHFGDEGPQHEVIIDDFWMGKYEVTWDLYNLFVTRELDADQILKDQNSSNRCGCCFRSYNTLCGNEFWNGDRRLPSYLYDSISCSKIL